MMIIIIRKGKYNEWRANDNEECQPLIKWNSSNNDNDNQWW